MMKPMAKKPAAKKKLTRKKTKRRTPGAGKPEWPVTRNVMFRPERMKYVRRLIRPEGCVFCHALKEGVKPESLVLCENGQAMLMLNKFPYNSGHLLVLPKRHNGEFTELTDSEMRDVNALMKIGVEILNEAYRPGGFNMGLNLGSVAGAGIPEHLHWHILPRWAGDANFYPLIAEIKVVIETLEQTYGRLAPLIEARGLKSGSTNGVNS